MFQNSQESKMRLQQHSWVNHGTHSWITDVESDITFASRQILFLNVSSSEKIPWLIPQWEINKCFSNQIFVNCDFVQCSSKNWPSKNYFSKIIGRKSDEFLSVMLHNLCGTFNASVFWRIQYSEYCHLSIKIGCDSAR